MEQFVKLNLTSNNRINLLNFVKDNTNWIHKNAFDISLVPLNLLDNFLLKFKYQFFGVPVIFKMQPWQFYRFHIDESRSCAINLLIEGTDSNTYYGEETNDEEILNIKELNYQEDSYYLINTKLKHCVINRNNVRYMFSMGFPSNITYEQVKLFCQNNNLL